MTLRSSRIALRLALSSACLSSAIAFALAQPAAPANPFEPMAFLVGKWEGTVEGQAGKGTVRREAERVLGGRFLRVLNRSEYPAQERNPKGEIHEDEGFYSFDRARKRLVLRQFHVEGFVNQYVHDGEASPSRIVFTSEALENVPAGWQARETYVLQGPDAFEEIFELAQAGKPFEVYSRTQLRRIK
jgi:hypothetical protein